MSKNMTRKGLAFGAGLALVASGLGAAPAQADGITGLIALEAYAGPTSVFSVVAGTNYDFQVVAKPASTIGSAGTTKFLVTDPSLKVLPVYNSLIDDGTAYDTDSVAAAAVAMDTSDVLNFLTNGDLVISGIVTTNKISTGDFIAFDAAVQDDDGNTILAADTVVEAKAVTSTTITIDASDVTRPIFVVKATDDIGDTAGVGNDVVLSGLVNDPTGIFDVGDDVVVLDAIVDGTPTTVIAAGAGPFNVGAIGAATITLDDASAADNLAQTAVATDATIALEESTSNGNNKASTVYRPTAVSGTYVVDSHVADGSAIAFAVKTSDAETRTVTIQAWVDNFDNDKIDSTEYVSAPVTVTFVKASTLEATTTLSSPNVGDELLTATIVTSPVLNGAQLDASDVIAAVFTRNGYATKLLTNTRATQDNTTAVWTTTIDLAPTGDDPGDTLSSYTLDGTETTADWGVAGDVPDKVVVGANDTDKTDGTEAANEMGNVSIAATTGVVTVTTDANHNLSNGDLIDFEDGSSGELVQITTAAGNDRPVTITGDKTFTFVLDTTATVTASSVADADLEADTTYTVVTYTTGDADQYFLDSRVTAGDYSATAYFSANGDAGAGTAKWNPISTAAAKGTLAVTAADVILTTVGSASVQSIRENDATNDSVVDLLLKAGTTSATVIATVVDADGDAVGSGRSVSVTPSGATAGAGIKVAGSATLATILTTDANGQVEIVVTSLAGTNGQAVDITVVAEGAAATTSILEVAWATAALQMSDLAVSGSKLNVDQGDANKEVRYVAEGASYAMNLLVTDQWYTVADSATYRLKVTGAGVTAGFVTLVDGKATVTVTDAGVSTSFDSTLTLQKKSAAGVWGDTTSVAIVNTKTDDNPGVLLGADGSTLYGQDGSETADLSDAVAAKALVERDTRSSFVSQPVYTNSVVVTGKIVDAGTKAALGGAVVTVSGPSNILFVNGSVESRGSITFLASEADGEFDVTLYSTTAQTNSVITVTSMGVSKTTKVSFTGIGIGEGTVLTVTTPAAVKPASTFQVGAKLADAYGNGVASATVKVTYTGAGIVFGTLPTTTDANGEIAFSVLLGSNDTGTVSVTVSYDQNADLDYLDAKDLVVTSTTEITASGVVASAAKVNAGSFKGYVALYAKGYKGQRMSAKVGKDWVVVASLASNFERVVEFTGAGVDVAVRIYIDRVLLDTINLTTK